MPLTGSSVHFGDFEIDLESAELYHNGDKVRLQEQPFHILVALLEQPGKVVTRETLRQRLWPSDVFVDYERSLNAAVKRLRQALGDEAETPRYIETLPRLGYRFVGQVENEPKAKAEAPRTRRRWVVTAIAALVLLASGLFMGRVIWYRLFPPSIRSIAVLPLKNLSQDQQQEYFAIGMTEALMSELSRMEPLRVTSLTSVMKFANTKEPLPQIAKQLGVDGIVEGSVLRDGDQVRIRAELVAAKADRTIWSGSYDGDLRDILKLQTQVAHDIASKIQINIASQEKARAASLRTVDPEAQEAYLRGQYYLNRWNPVLAKKAFDLAIQKDPGYAAAYAGLAKAIGGPASTMPQQAREMALKAISLDDSLADAHTALSMVLFLHDWNWAEAEREFRRALQLDPSSADAHTQYAYFLAAMGRFDEGIVEARQAQRLDPFSLSINVSYGRMFYFSRQYDLAIEQFNQTLLLDGRYPQAFTFRGFTKLTMGRYDAAFADLRHVNELARDKKMLDLIDQNYPQKGAAQTLREWAKLWESDDTYPVRQCSAAYEWAQAGEIDKAIQSLEKNFQMRCRQLVNLKIEPALDNLRSDPRFNEMVKRMNFPE